MRKLLSLALITGLSAALSAACTTNNNTDAIPSANGVFPSSGFAGRQLRVEISGDNTNWTAPTVTFGDGITVGAVTVASPTDIFAEITIASDAAFGMRDVKVSDAGSDNTLTMAFEVASPLEVQTTGTLAQGSVLAMTIINHDFDSPFDVANLTVTGGSGVTVNVGSASTAYSISATLLVDTDATSGPLTVVSGVGSDAITSQGDTLTIAPRTAMPLTAGTPTAGTVAKALDSQLYSLTAAQAALVTVAATTTNTNAAPAAILLPASGKFADLIGFSASVSTVGAANEKFFVIYWDNSGTMGYQYSLKATAQTFASMVTETEPNDTKATAQATTTYPALFTGTIHDDVDEDWIKVTLTAGKKLHIITTAPGGLADSEIIFLGTDGTTVIDDIDADVGEDYTSPAQTAAGTYFVKIVPSAFALQLLGYAPADDPYQAFIEVL